MQIIDKGPGNVQVKLTQAEGRFLRNASYVLKRIAAVTGADDDAKQAADVALSVANKYTPTQSQEKLNKEDQEQIGGA